jgi:ectoine hydroxylase-related dioxygenase (phytanoyl-CoA dioxygenase family)
MQENSIIQGINNNEIDKQLLNEGIIHLKDLFTQSELRKALKNNSFLEQERIGLPEDSIYIKLFKHPKIRKSIIHLLNTNNYHLTTLSSNTLFPNVDKRAYHVDWPYHKYTQDSGDINTIYEDRLDGVQVIIPLDNFTIENGATMYIPYSYLARRYPSIDILKSGTFEAADSKNENEEDKNNEEENKKPLFVCKKKYLLGKVGDVFIYPSTLWHSQGLNITNKPRRALLANFSPKNINKKDY